jgi:hypothetical protein
VKCNGSRAALLLLRNIFQRFPDKSKKEMHELKYEGKNSAFSGEKYPTHEKKSLYLITIKELNYLRQELVLIPSRKRR